MLERSYYMTETSGLFPGDSFPQRVKAFSIVHADTYVSNNVTECASIFIKACIVHDHCLSIAANVA